MEFRAGQTIAGNLTLRRLLGKGGMGTVWVAQHQALNAEVAIKFIHEEFARNESVRTRFQREAAASASVRSPHVVQVFDYGVVDGSVPFIVMELLDGEDLRDRIEKRGPLPLKELVQVVVQACKGLGKAHAAGIVHRDIKPDNLFLVDSDGDIFVKILDFGVAKSATDAGLGMTSTGTMVGTPYYMSPEQILSSKHVDGRSDIWSLGTVAYHALTGRVPFDGETVGALAVAIKSGRYLLPFAELGTGSPKLDAWFQRALAQDLEYRFRDTREMAQALCEATEEAQVQRIDPQPPRFADGIGAATLEGAAISSLPKRDLPVFWLSLGAVLFGALVLGVAGLMWRASANGAEPSGVAASNEGDAESLLGSAKLPGAPSSAGMPSATPAAAQNSASNLVGTKPVASAPVPAPLAEPVADSKAKAQRNVPSVAGTKAASPAGAAVPSTPTKESGREKYGF